MYMYTCNRNTHMVILCSKSFYITTVDQLASVLESCLRIIDAILQNDNALLTDEIRILFCNHFISHKHKMPDKK